MTRLTTFVIAALSAVGVAAPASAVNLFVNGSFETPAVTAPLPYTYTDHQPGSSTLTGWTIANSVVSQLRSDYAGNPGYSFPAQDGLLSLDLAGFNANGPAIVSQALATTIGATYRLSFWVGNVSGGPFGTDTSIRTLFSSGGKDFTCVNAIAGFTLAWQQCTQQFVATAGSTTIGFQSLDPDFDNSAVIDNVSLERLTDAVPEPGNWALMIVGIGAIGSLQRRRRRASSARDAREGRGRAAA